MTEQILAPEEMSDNVDVQEAIRIVQGDDKSSKAYYRLLAIADRLDETNASIVGDLIEAFIVSGGETGDEPEDEEDDEEDED